MKIVKFYGGLGNQLFQYAMLVAVREHYGEETMMDTSIYASYGLHNGLEINRIFNTTAKEASKEQIKQVSWFTKNYKLSRVYHYLLPAKSTEYKERVFGKYYPDVFDKIGDCLYDGYWQHHEYFANCREAILKEFSLREPLDKTNKEYYDLYKGSSEYVSVHVRRGDFQKSDKYRGICEKEYYVEAIKKAAEIVGKDVHFVFFSNDIKWCQENLAPLICNGQTTFVNHNTGANSYKDMILMSACRVNIIANSSFSWWGAYLNRRKDKAVIAPKKWINRDMPNPIQVPEWIKL